jgi:exodeoxyribonuclease VII large subunit
LERLAGRLTPQALADRVGRRAERVGVLGARLTQGALHALGRQRRHLDACAKLLASLSYQGVLKRGFALVRDAEGNSVRSARQVAPGVRLDIELADGHVAVRAETADAAGESPARAPPAARRLEPRSDPRPEPRPESGRPAKGKEGRAGTPEDQGSLF